MNIDPTDRFGLLSAVLQKRLLNDHDFSHFAPDMGHEIPPENGGGRCRGQNYRRYLVSSRKRAADLENPAVRDEWAEKFAAYGGFPFPAGGRIVAGAGTDRDVTLFNCFVMGIIPDDMSGIFEHLREAALTMQQGGGIGYDFSTLRPKGARVHGVGADASGPLSFMDVWDSMCRTIMSAGHRRGAMMATLRCDHPDIESFIAAKQEAGRLRMFNLSVLVTDDFMDAVRGDRDWDLSFNGTTYKTVSARELWDHIMEATREYAEPGVIFIDRINRANNLGYCETIAATNPAASSPFRLTAHVYSARSIWPGS